MAWKTKEQQHKYYLEHRQELNTKARAYIARTPEEHKDYARRYYRSHKDEIRQYYQDNREHLLLYANQRRLRKKIEVVTHYGKGKPACVQCGESRLACLTIDHINGGGERHRRLLKREGTEFYQWLIVKKFPKGYQTLCANCQMVKTILNNESNPQNWASPLLSC